MPVLLLVSAAGGNIPTSTLLDDRQFRITVLVTEYADPAGAVAAARLVFNSIGDADLCWEGLEAACRLLGRTDRPVINDPRAVLKTGRAANVERLRGLAQSDRAANGDGAAAQLASGRSRRYDRGKHGFAFPFLFRPPGFHTGRYFSRVENLPDSPRRGNAIPGDDMCLIEQLDARDGDGFLRKLRVMIIDRKIYPLHLAISRHWKMHYFTRRHGRLAP